jgi:choline dehydrogenase
MSRKPFISVSDAVAMQPDYIVVGGGPGGCVVAGRLSEDANTKVLLVEAGRDSDSWRVRWPFGTAFMVTRPGWDWGWETLPDASMEGRDVMWSSGKMLGGSSSINGQVFMRGLKTDFDHWDEAVGGDGDWSYDGLLPYFMKAETYNGPASPVRGKDGPVNVVELGQPHPIAEAFVKTGIDMGYEPTDLNGDQPVGFGYTQANQKDGMRFSAYDAYIRPNLGRPNLGVLIKHRAVRVVFDGNRAVGVEVISPDGTRTRLTAGREVIVSAGTAGTTNLLMKSGVGPREMLEKAGVHVQIAAPALGQNLQEHPGFSVSRFIKGAWSFNQAQIRPDLGLRYLYRLIAKHDGPFAAPAILAMGYAHTTPDRSGPPELQLHFMPFAYRLRPGDKSPVTAQIPKRSAVLFMATLTKPHGRGTISITDSDPVGRPVIDHQLLGDERDLLRLVTGAKILTEMFQSPHVAPYVVDQCNPQVDPADDGGWVDYVRRNSYTAYHMVGTARMGQRDDPEAVVDRSLRLIGAEGLRIVDASVIPVVPSANTFLPVVAVGEKAADIIRQGG